MRGSGSGEDNCSAILENKQVEAMRQEYREKPFNIKEKAQSLGVGVNAVQRALKGQSFKNLDGSVSLKGRDYNSGEKNCSSVLKDRQVLDLRKLYKKEPFVIASMARSIGVSTPTLWKALTGRTFKHLPDKAKVNRAISNEVIDRNRREYNRRPFVLEVRARELGIASSTFYRAMKEHRPGCSEPPIKPPRSVSL